MNQKDIEHWLLPRKDVIWTYVIENEGVNGK